MLTGLFFFFASFSFISYNIAENVGKEKLMFRIRNWAELKRMIALLQSLDNSTVKFPVDIFSDEEQISAVQCGKGYRCAFAYTNADGRVEIDGPLHARDLRHSLQAMDAQFEKELEEEETSVQDTES